MNLPNLITNVLTLSVSGLFTIILAYYFVKNDFKRYLSLKEREIKKEDRRQLLSLTLQAHERIIVFIDRINPSNLFIRLHQQELSVKEFQAIILNDIRSEYQHNITQQLYVSAENWVVVKKLKEDTIAMINNAVGGLPPGNSSMDLSRIVLQHMADIKDDPYELTLDLIKKSIHQLL